MGTHYLWDPIEDNIIEEFDDTGGTLVDYTTEPTPFGDLISQFREGDSSFYHYDGQGSTLALSNSHGVITDTYAYSGFGVLVDRFGNTKSPFQYIGRHGYYRYSDNSSYWIRQRIFDSSYGRWLSVDPLLMGYFIGGMHMALNYFAYVSNCPALYVDPSGLCKVKSFTVTKTGKISQQFGSDVSNLAESNLKENYPTSGFDSDLLGRQCVAAVINVYGAHLGVRCVHPFIVHIEMTECSGPCGVNVNEFHSEEITYPIDKVTLLPDETKGVKKGAGDKFTVDENTKEAIYVHTPTSYYIQEELTGKKKKKRCGTLSLYYYDAPSAYFSRTLEAKDNLLRQFWDITNSDTNTVVLHKQIVVKLSAFTHTKPW